MSNSNLNRICNDENDLMLHLTMRCKHKDLMQLETSWSEDNPARRFWSYPRFPLSSIHISLLFLFNISISSLCMAYFMKIYASTLDGGILRRLICDPSPLLQDWRIELRNWKKHYNSMKLKRRR